MAFNKAKTLEAAQKHLAAGKLPQAIAEYQQILRAEPEDQVTLMTVGDLYVRVGDIQQAMVFFEKLAQIFTADGFISKSIAIYKKIAKIAPDEITPLERLAELYVQQGVMSEARPIFLQLAEAHLKANRTQPAIEVLKKLLDLAPDNLRVQQRLADLYLAIGQEKEASNAFINTAQRLLEKGDSGEALKMAEKALQAFAKNPAAAAIKARCLGAANRPNDAIELLAKLPPSMMVPETSTLLTELYLQQGRSEEALKLARSAVTEGRAKFGLVFGVVNGLLQGGETDRGLQLLGEIRSHVLQAGETERLVSALQSAMDRLPGRLEPLEWLADAYRATGDPFHLPEALSQLTDGALAAGDWEKARKALTELVEKDPENESYRQRLRNVNAKLGIEAEPEVSLETVVPFEEELHAAAAQPVEVTEAPPDEETERFVSQALTDVDLFTSYGLTQKGIDLLESVLKRLPQHPATLEKLLDLYLGAGNEKRTAEIAGQLEEIYTKKNDSNNADKFAELRRRFQRAAGRTEEAAAAAAPAAPEFSVPVEAVPAVPEPAPLEVVEEVTIVDSQPVSEQAQAHEVDLSSEWESMAVEAAPPEAVQAPATPSVAPEEPTATFEEITLEVEEAAPPVVEAVPEAPPPAPEQVAVASQPPVEEAFSYDFTMETVMEEAAPEAPPEAAVPEAVPQAEPAIEIPPEPIPSEQEAAQVFGEVAAEIAPAPPAPPAPVPPAPVEEPVAAAAEEDQGTIEYDFEAPSAQQEEPAAVEEAAAPEPVEEPAAAPAMSASQFLSELTDELGDFGLAPVKEEAAAPAAKAAGKGEKKAPPEKPAEKRASDQLREVFDEFRADMGDATEADEEGEDLETHYNLGIAYREMGLAEEAIGEFQKVAKSVQAGKPFKYSMQCYTLLGLTFMDKGQPKISAIWYEKALKTPDLDPESVMAVRYDLGVAQELAGDYKAALESFSQVYAMNIDYRDVSERIADLHKKA